VDPMTRRETETAHTPAKTGDSLLPVAQRRLVRFFPWHVGAFLVGNLLLNGVNALAGGSWWAFWPLVVTALMLTVHYLFYKAATVDERWAQARTEELNLKSYDRSHIEGLKSRYGGDNIAGDHRS
jgi:hypothetical protein